MRVISPILAFVSLVGCGALGATEGGNGTGGGIGSSVGTTTQANGLPCDVNQTLQTSCRACHGAQPQFGAPMPLVTYADLTAPAKSDATKRVIDLVLARTHEGARPMPPPPNARLDANAQSALDTWIRAGAPSAADACTVTTTPSQVGVAKGLSCEPDQRIRPPTKFAMPKGKSDQIVCYGFDVTHAAKRHIVALGPRLDNTRIVHHMILFQADQAAPTTPTECGLGQSAGWRFIGGWAPGGSAYELPAEAGFPQEGTTHYVMQVHYNNQQGLDGQLDESGFDLCTTDKLRANDADVMASGTIDINLAPRSGTDKTCGFTWPAGKIHVFGASPHMHRLGTSLSITRVRKNAGDEKILDRPNFDFNGGGGGEPTSVDLEQGDSIRTHCGWKNTSDAAVTYGENTSNEMCFGFMMYYPRITSSIWRFGIPAALAQCTTSTGAL